MELRVGDLDITRRLFERVTSLPVPLSSKKMKYFFKRWLAFEKEFGTDQTVARVKQKAQDYLDSKAH
jgi:rRNA biogenesis protein RRP5